MGQQYEPLNVRGMPMVYSCTACGAVVSDMTLHDDWHAWAELVGRRLNSDYLNHFRARLRAEAGHNPT
jgi:hypothetical protein